nr:NUDIX hydrolase N-terminal domain-containing protein [Paeniclostridium sordellii]
MSQLQGIAQTGLHYSKDIYDIERYEQLKSITLKLIQELSNEPTEKIELFLDSDTGYSAGEVAIKEVQEEVGINVTTKQIISVYDKFKRRYKPSLEYVYNFY